MCVTQPSFLQMCVTQPSFLRICVTQTCRFRNLPRSEIFSLMAAALFYILPNLLFSYALTPILTLLSMRYLSKMSRKGFSTHESIKATLTLYFYGFDLFWRWLTASETLRGRVGRGSDKKANSNHWAGAEILLMSRRLAKLPRNKSRHIANN